VAVSQLLFEGGEINVAAPGAPETSAPPPEDSFAEELSS
jgi:hypothetical protein